MKIIQEDSQT